MWKLVLFCSVLGFTFSCVSKRKLTYLNNKSSEQTAPLTQYQLRVGDDLFIEIKSPDPSSSSFYNLKGDAYSGPYNDAFIYLNSHSVNQSGDVKLPFIGDIHVEGLTVSETIQKIEAALTEHLRDATVFVKLANFKITVLGEVNDPGTFAVHDNKITIFQAIGLAGDLTNYGKRKTVKVIRRENEVANTFIVDLTNYDVFASECYFVKPHDVIYVEPMRIRPAEMNLKPISVFLSGTAVILLILRTLE